MMPNGVDFSFILLFCVLMKAVLCRCMLESRGLVVRSIPFYEWNSAEDAEQQKAYLSHLLASAYAFGYQ